MNLLLNASTQAFMRVCLWSLVVVELGLDANEDGVSTIIPAARPVPMVTC